MNKKWLSVLLCLCLLLGMTACQQTAAPTTGATDTVETAGEAVTETAEAVTETAEAVTETAEAVTETAEAVTETAEAAAEAPAALTPAFNDSDVLLTINGEAVTWAQAKPYYEQFVAQYSSYYDMSLQENVDIFAAVATDNAQLEVLLLQKAAELGLYPLSDADMAAALEQADAIYEENVQYCMAQQHPELSAESTEEAMAAAREEAVAYLKEQGLTLEYARENYPKSLVLDNLFTHLTQDVTVTDADVEAQYQAQVEQDKALYENDIDAYIAYNGNVDMNNMYMMYTGQGTAMDYAWYRPAGFRGVKHILLSVDESLMQEYQNVQAQLEEQIAGEGEESAEAAEPAATQADLDNAKAAILAANQEKIDEINQRLANGEEFEALIPEYTVDRDTLYEVSVASTNYVPEFVEAAFSVENVGDVSAPYISQFGIHIVKYVEDIPAGPIEMTAEQREAKFEQLLSERKNEAYAASLEEMKSAATIEYTGLVMSYDELLNKMMAEEAAAETAEAVEETETAETVTEEPAAE